MKKIESYPAVIVIYYEPNLGYSIVKAESKDVGVVMYDTYPDRDISVPGVFNDLNEFEPHNLQGERVVLA